MLGAHRLHKADALAPLASLRRLRTLDLGGCNLEESLGAWVGALLELRTLLLGHNRLCDPLSDPLPPGLAWLDLSHNELLCEGDLLKGLLTAPPALEHLDLSHSFPPDQVVAPRGVWTYALGRLPALRTLSLSSVR